MHICIVYDCLFPWTIGGAERWYRQLAETHAAQGHRVTYLTLCQWDTGEPPALPGVRVIAVGPRLALYADGKRRIAPPLLFGLGVLWHLLRHGRRYDLVHGASFPFFSLLAAGLARPLGGYRLAVDWHEVWTRDYWRAYLGPLGGAVGWAVQALCARVPQVAFSFSRLHAARAEALGTGPVTLLEGEYAGPALQPVPAADPPLVLYAGRMIPEKRVPLLVAALARLMQTDPCLRAVLVGRGPDLEPVRAEVARLGLAGRIELPGFVPTEALERLQAEAAVVVQPSEREGYGMIVVEASARGVPVVLVAGPDNAAVELVEPGENGFVAAEPTPPALAEAIGAALAGGPALRARVLDWYARHAQRLSFGQSFARIGAALAAGPAAGAPTEQGSS
ncbi:glycosyltransferase family 4 protein [Novosphingobium piscinae]|uniref:Glycosyltransferase family 4 protein n=1 Tax=Novosphingobium piscinae TaxID=1507448 RepID=A0A7X1KRT0_9SPHN|nr:glycosyltransferase family 4 protein [Novosphingobium piscinae]MBC2670903.1 glycosyltransferase family 4 protein [Novosphingobium piscinae]